MKKIDLIYIVGEGHSGSTLLDLLLGSHSCIESAGEIAEIAKYYFDTSKTKIEDININYVGDDLYNLCTCGNTVHTCDYWNNIIRNAGGTDMLSNLRARKRKDFMNSNCNLIRAILKESGKEIFCDSSKDTIRLIRLVDSKFFNIVSVHLVRDGRAVAYSFKKKGERLNKNIPRYNYYEAIKMWRKINNSIYRISHYLPNYMCIKYEDFVKHPRKYVADILSKFNLKFEEDQLQFWKYSHHNIGGNRLRITANQEIKSDIKFLQGLSFIEWYIGTLSGLSGLKNFNYPFFRKSKHKVK